MVIGGVWHALTGIAALLHDEVYIKAPEYTYSFDLTGWGWTYLYDVSSPPAPVSRFSKARCGHVWKDPTGRRPSMIVNFMFLPHYPLWSLVIIAVDVGVIWALATYRRETL